MKCYIVQLDIAWRDKIANFERVKTMLSEAKVSPNSLVVLPEMFATGFDVSAEGVVEGRDHALAETGVFLSALAQELQVCVQGSGIALAPDGKRQNLTVAYGPNGTCLATYQKMHPFTFGGEHKRFQAGDELVMFEVDRMQVSPFICYDLRFPEVFRHAAIKGAQVLSVVANWPSSRHGHWLPLLQARAIENQCYVIGVNRVGKDQYVEYEGQSVVFGPKGEQLALAGKLPEVLCVDLDLEQLLNWRQEFPVLADIKKRFLGLT